MIRTAGVARSRLVFPYPSRTNYNGTGNIDDASNFIPTSHRWCQGTLRDLHNMDQAAIALPVRQGDHSEASSAGGLTVGDARLSARRRVCKHSQSSTAQRT